LFVDHVCAMWWPWFNTVDDIYIVQFFIIVTIVYTYSYKNIYYLLLYTFVLFFLVGIYLAINQVELFTAFLWLVECSVLFVFLLLLFYLNIKGVFVYTFYSYYKYICVCWTIVCITFLSNYTNTDSLCVVLSDSFSLIDNYYEAVYNIIGNDLVGFMVSYYFINGFEFLLVGFLLLVGSVICVNLYQMNKGVKNFNYKNFLNIFNFFLDFSSFFFIRRQNLIKQGNVKPSLKLFKKL